MHVVARYYGFFSTLTRKLSEPVEAEEGLTVSGLLEMLSRSYGYRFRMLCFVRPLYSDREYANVCLNTRDINSFRKFPQGLETVLHDGDTVSFGVMSGAA
ncbi:MAG: hypothetical protein GKC10_03105 [Methanosarcinales archaeon]|nr:hypothetical protein [Methanosarcinales archaeon]